MIFVTVGSQLPFDRLIITVDQWAQQHSDYAVFAQIGLSSYSPKAMQFKSTMTPGEYYEAMNAADLIVAHAGMGTIISALELGKPMLLMPRLAAQGEHRNDHQLATLKQITQKFTHIATAKNESELQQKLEDYRMKNQCDQPFKKEPIAVSPELLDAVKSFIAAELQ